MEVVRYRNTVIIKITKCFWRSIFLPINIFHCSEGIFVQEDITYSSTYKNIRRLYYDIRCALPHTLYLKILSHNRLFDALVDDGLEGRVCMWEDVCWSHVQCSVRSFVIPWDTCYLNLLGFHYQINASLLYQHMFSHMLHLTKKTRPGRIFAAAFLTWLTFERLSLEQIKDDIFGMLS